MKKVILFGLFAAFGCLSSVHAADQSAPAAPVAAPYDATAAKAALAALPLDAYTRITFQARLLIATSEKAANTVLAEAITYVPEGKRGFVKVPAGSYAVLKDNKVVAFVTPDKNQIPIAIQ